MNIKELREQRAILLDELDNICKSVEVEKRTLNAEEEELVTKKMDAIKSIDKTIEVDKQRRNLEKFEVITETNPVNNEEISKKNFLAYVRNKDASALDVSTNGVFIPKNIADQIVDKVYDLCPLLELAHVVRAKGELTIPVYDDTTDVVVGYIDDLAELTSNVGKFNTTTLNNYIFGALAIISKSLINNTDFDLLSYIEDRIALGFAKTLSKEGFTGADKVQGLFTGGNVDNVITTTKLDDSALITLQNSVPTEYQSNSVWVMNRATLLKCKLLKDTNGRSLLNPDLVQGFGWTILGQRVLLDMNVPDDSVFYGDLSGYWFKISQDLEINVLYEQFAVKHAVGVYAYAELDGKPVEQQKLAILTVGVKA